VVLDADPTTAISADIGQIGVVATLVNGEAVYDPAQMFDQRLSPR
jgi:predicted amidohydrolase YtcJ